MEGDRVGQLQRELLIHLLDHRGQQVRFEADQWTTEFGILRKFSQEDALGVKQALRSLEMSRLIYRRVQYVIGFSEPKLVYSLTPSGHRKAVDLRRAMDLKLPPEPETPDLGPGAGPRYTDPPETAAPEP